MKFIVITGTPIVGFDYTGTFDDIDDALNYARKKHGINGMWWIGEINEPKRSSQSYDEISNKELYNVILDYMAGKEIHGIDPAMMVDIDKRADPADTESYAASLPGIDLDILRILDEEDIPL